MDRTVRLWDAATGAPVGPTLVHPAAVGSLDFSPDGRTLATASDQARHWDVATGKPIGPPLGRSGRSVPCRFSPDGRRLIFADDRVVRVVALAAPWTESPGAAAERAQRLTQPGSRSESGPPAVAPAPRPTPAATPRPIAIAWHEAAGNQALAEGAWDTALWRLDRLVALKPADPWSRVRRAQALARLGRLEDARAELRAAIRDPEGADVPPWIEDFAMGSVSARDWLAVLPFADEVVAARPGRAEGYVLRFQANSALGRDAEASADSARLAGLPGAPAALRTACAEWFRRGDATLAGRLMEHVGPVAELSEKELHALALCRLDRGDLAGYREVAAAIVARLGRPQPPSRSQANAMLWTLTLGPDAVPEWPAMIRWGERVVASAPAEARHGLLNSLGGLLCRAGRDEEAVRVLKEGIGPTGAPVFEDRIFLAISLHRLGRRDEARAQLDQIAASRNPLTEDPWARLEREVLRREAEAVVAR